MMSSLKKKNLKGGGRSKIRNLEIGKEREERGQEVRKTIFGKKKNLGHEF